MAKPPTSNIPLKNSGQPKGVETGAGASADGTVGKGHATPTRREREAANIRPLVTNDRKAANRASRAKMAEAREKARLGMAAGEEKYLPVRDRGPQRRFVRDYIDARFNVGEAMIPLMFVVILGTVVPGFEVYSLLVLWAFFVLAIGDCVLLGFIVKRKIRAKFGDDAVQSGTRWYAAMRALQLRPMRLPKPQVKRRQYPS
ncbi:MAG: hypothetical protein RI885_1526 [Actinomycetota bacterium]|jgi:hypothetical protein